VTEVRSFVGLVGYYVRFIKNFSNIHYPITTLQNKGKRLEWTIDCVASFNQLKQLLTKALVLRITYPKMDFIVCTYSCKERLGGVLMQESQVFCYGSQKLNEHEQHYVSHDLELVSIIHALNMWRHYLLNRKFSLMNDHGGLKYLFE